MGEPRLVRVERFEELATGMRVVVKPCRQPGCHGRHCGFLGDELVYSLLSASGRRILGPARPVIGDLCAGGARSGVNREAVSRGDVYRFASDLGIADQLAAETNPYLSRSTVGTNGHDEVVVAAKERTR